MQMHKNKRTRRRRMTMGRSPTISGSTAEGMLKSAGFQDVEAIGADKGSDGETNGNLAAWADGFVLKLGWFSGWLMIDWSDTNVEIRDEFWKRWGDITQEDMLDIILKDDFILIDKSLRDKTLAVLHDILVSNTN